MLIDDGPFGAIRFHLPLNPIRKKRLDRVLFLFFGIPSPGIAHRLSSILDPLFFFALQIACETPDTAF